MSQFVKHGHINMFQESKNNDIINDRQVHVNSFNQYNVW